MISIKSPIYQATQIREFEELAKTRFGITEQMMMHRAGKAAFDFLLRRWPQAQKITVFTGSGNNGGDGYVVALLAKERGLKVSVWQVGALDHQKEEAKQARVACEKAGIPILPFDDKADLERPDVIIDALCGIGLRTPLRDETVMAVEKLTRPQVPILSLDIPSGINADTGEILGAAVRATATITFIGLKLGLLTGSGIAHTGELILSDLQFPSELFSHVEPVAEKIQLSSYQHYLKPRSRDWHKGLSGHVLVIGGEAGYSGAPRMAAQAALRVGAGLVSVATHPLHAAFINIDCPEIMCHGIKTPKQLDPLLARADVVILGPGLSQTDWAHALWTYVCEQQNLPLVVDADGLNILSQTTLTRENWVLTPHPGEAARLIEETSSIVQADRLTALKAIAKRYGGVSVLKGAGSLVLAPHSLPGLCDKGNPGMASAGMGDILSGVIAGFIAQGVPLGDAAKLGVLIHAMAGDLAAKDGERGMIAMDLMPYLRRLSNSSSAT